MNRIFRRAVRKYKHDGLYGLCRISWQILYRKTRQNLINTRLDRCSTIDNHELEKMSSQTFEYAPAERVFIPEITQRVTDSQRTRTGEYNLPPLQFFVLENCSVTDNGVILTSDREVILESTRSEQYRLMDLVKNNVNTYSDWLRFFLTPNVYFSRSNNIQQEYDIAISFIPYKGWENYYHWILEILPQIRAFETYKRKTGDEPLIILPPNAPDFFTESLSLAGIESHQWVELSSKSVFVNKLILPETWYWSNKEYTPSRITVDWLQKRLQSRIDINNSPFSPNIYISRTDAENRNIQNESEVMKVLDKFGFEKYILSKHSVQEQIQMFSNANHIVAPHGAGLVNIIFGENLNVLEFVGKTHQKNHFYCLSGLLGHNYEYMTCEKNSGDYYVEIEDLYAKLDSKI